MALNIAYTTLIKYHLIVKLSKFSIVDTKSGIPIALYNIQKNNYSTK